VGDGLGHGPERLNGFLPTSGYTQLAAYGCNGLLLGVTQGQISGTMAPPVRYIALALREWAAGQLWRLEALPARCWISRSPRLDYRRCPEPRMLDVLVKGELGTMEDHASALDGPGALMGAVSVGLFFDPERLPRREIQRLGAETAALTHGDPAAFLSAAALSHIISRIVWDRELRLEKLAGETGAMLKKRFGREYRQAAEVAARLLMARTLARSEKFTREESLARLGRSTAAQVLAGSIYCCLTGTGEPEEIIGEAAMWSPAGAAVVGAILGAVRGEEALPKLWREELEENSVLRELAEDMYRGCPMMKGSRVFDIEWDEKYAQGAL
jgi:ADP-ribosylglycohydrolase